jgi:hypothetical protein
MFTISEQFKITAYQEKVLSYGTIYQWAQQAPGGAVWPVFPRREVHAVKNRCVKFTKPLSALDV